MTRVVIIDYTNHRGERRERRVSPNYLMFGTHEYHPEAQWLLDAWDVEKGAYRTFAVQHIHGWRPA
jgi:predicted DNA-binding transcriptional regulator YafY